MILDAAVTMQFYLQVTVLIITHENINEERVNEERINEIGNQFFHGTFLLSLRGIQFQVTFF